MCRVAPFSAVWPPGANRGPGWAIRQSLARLLIVPAAMLAAKVRQVFTNRKDPTETDESSSFRYPTAECGISIPPDPCDHGEPYGPVPADTFPK